MCGILGIIGQNLPEDRSNQLNFEEMLSSLAHRGPDDKGIVRDGNLLLGHQRLSIMDVEGAHQPFSREESQLYGVCNGEIYNYQDLRDRFNDRFSFQTHGDSEVLLPLYQECGQQLAHHLDGMFSFVLSNGKDYVAARDPIGIKPLYYGKSGDMLFFSSEIKALVQAAEEIREFPEGHYYHPETGFVPYYQWPDESSFLSDVDEVLEKIRQTLSKSVQKRLMSDVPVGVFLSGGLDSSVIAALMSEHLPELHSFSVGLPDSPDLKAARLVAEHLGTIHHEYIYTEEEMEAVLPQVIYYLESYDPALIRSAIPCYFVSRLASQYVKVVLTGEGSDELFAGYSYFKEYEDATALHRESISILKGLHNLNLQRVDRMTMANSLEARVPFLDTEFIELCLKIDPSLKLHKTYGLEKWLLRQAFADKLPQEVVWRDKMEFAQGCASSTILEDRANAMVSQAELDAARRDGVPVNSKEELFYYRIFHHHFPHPDAPALIGRWQGTLH
ncbi:asparagine synthase B [Baaleninema sp.]|uniref:asparagine synthase B n=1 Tax=Baaleninema sp. TaxID=3101197 RepID=UPI003D02E4F7